MKEWIPTAQMYMQCFSVLQHVDIAALLIKFNTCVNAVDRWGFTPLHEAAQKGRTQLCALLVSAPRAVAGSYLVDFFPFKRINIMLTFFHSKYVYLI